MWTMHIIFPNELPSPPIRTVVNSVNSCHHHKLCFLLICLKKKLQNWSIHCHTHTHIWCKETIYKQLSVCVHRDVQVGLKKEELWLFHTLLCASPLLDPRPLRPFSLLHGRGQHPPGHPCSHLSPSQVHQQPSSEPKRDWIKRKRRHDTIASTHDTRKSVLKKKKKKKKRSRQLTRALVHWEVLCSDQNGYFLY